MSFIDHQGSCELPVNIALVFNTICEVVPNISGMKIDSADKLLNRITVKAGVSLFSWGENIPIQLTKIDDNNTRIEITSTPKTGAMFGGAFDLGKNKKNIELILSETSKRLQEKLSK